MSYDAQDTEDMYQELVAKNGRTMYRKNGKLISKEEYDEGLKAQVPEGMVEPTVPEIDNYDTKPKRVCLFCGEPGMFQRFVNMNTYFLCGGHYHTTTLGQIVQRARELDGNTIQ